MYKVIIADDEKFIRNGLSKFITGEKLGFNVVQSFSDGFEAIEYIRENNVDVVLTDIRMLKVTGIEVAKFVYENKPDIKVVLISGYKEFEYAKKAMEFGVKHYILKPTDFDEVRDVFKELKELLDKEQEAQKEQENYRELLSSLKEEFYIDLCLDAFRDKGVLMKKVRTLGFSDNINACPCAIMNIEMEQYEYYSTLKWKYGKDRLMNVFSNMFNVVQDDLESFLVYQRNKHIKLFVISGMPVNIDVFKKKCEDKIKELLVQLKEFFCTDFYLADIGWFHNIYGVAEFNGNTDKPTDNEEALLEKYNLLISHITSGNADEVQSIFDSFARKVSEYTLDDVKSWVHDILSQMYGRLETIFGVDVSKIGAKKYDYENIFLIDDKIVILERCQKAVSDITKYVKTKKLTTNDIVIANAKKYIDENYDKDISMQDVADFVYYSSKYFSRLFKELTGERFSEYLVKIRMNRAIELLKDGERPDKVSAKVGYRDSKYFARMFKQYTGYSLKEYALLLNEVGNDG
ncbi:MAG: response regulator [Firmicutes bacterium]|nr:response regulator [Bacillota bacterium]